MLGEAGGNIDGIIKLSRGRWVRRNSALGIGILEGFPPQSCQLTLKTVVLSHLTSLEAVW